MKTFFDGVFIDQKKLEAEGIRYPIKLEYYKTAIDEENVETKYGIEIVKTEYLDGNVKIETNELKNITNDLAEENRILTLLRNNEVTPIALEEVLSDLLQ